MSVHGTCLLWAGKRGNIEKTARKGAVFPNLGRKEVIPMSKNLRRFFVKMRPVAQTIAAVVSAIAAILRIAKSLGF